MTCDCYAISRATLLLLLTTRYPCHVTHHPHRRVGCAFPDSVPHYSPHMSHVTLLTTGLMWRGTECVTRYNASNGNGQSLHRRSVARYPSPQSVAVPPPQERDMVYLLLTAYCLLLTNYYLLLSVYCSLQTTYYSLLTAHCSVPTAYCLLLTSYCLLRTSYCLLLTAYYLLLTTRYFLFTTHYPLPTTHYPLLTVHCWPLTVHYPLLTTYYSPPTTCC